MAQPTALDRCYPVDHPRTVLTLRRFPAKRTTGVSFPRRSKSTSKPCKYSQVTLDVSRQAPSCARSRAHNFVLASSALSTSAPVEQHASSRVWTTFQPVRLSRVDFAAHTAWASSCRKFANLAQDNFRSRAAGMRPSDLLELPCIMLLCQS